MANMINMNEFHLLQYTYYQMLGSANYMKQLPVSSSINLVFVAHVYFWVILCSLAVYYITLFCYITNVCATNVQNTDRFSVN